MQFHEKKLDLIDFTSFFAWTFFNFLAHCENLNSSIFNFTKKKILVFIYFFKFQANRRCRRHQEHHSQGRLRYYHQGRPKGPKEEITRCTKGKWATYSRRSFFSPQQFCGGRNIFCTTHYYDYEVT